MSNQVQTLIDPIKNKKFFKELSLKQLSIGTMEIENEHLYVSTSPSLSRNKKNETKSKIFKYNIEDPNEVWSYTYEYKILNTLNVSSLLIKKLIPTDKHLYVIGGGGYNKTHESVSDLYCNHFILKIDNETGEKVELTEFKDRIICSATLDNNFIYVAALLRENNDFVIYKYEVDKLDENSMETHLNDDKTNIFQSKFEKFSTRINIYVKNNLIYRGYDVPSKKKYVPKGKTRERDVPRTKLDKIDIKNQKIEKIISLDGGDTFNFQVMNNNIYTIINNDELKPDESLYNSSIPAKINLGNNKIEMKYSFDKEEFEKFVEDKKDSPKTNSILVKYGLIFAACKDGTIRVYDKKNGKLVHRILHNTAKTPKTKDLNNIAFIKANDKYLYTAVYDGNVKRWKFSELPIISDYITKKNTKKTKIQNTKKQAQVQNTKMQNTKKQAQVQVQNIESSNKKLIEDFKGQFEFKDVQECATVSRSSKNYMTKKQITDIINKPKYLDIKASLKQELKPKTLSSAKKEELCTAIFKIIKKS
jgi:WD40 repeat protein